MNEVKTYARRAFGLAGHLRKAEFCTAAASHMVTTYLALTSEGKLGSECFLNAHLPYVPPSHRIDDIVSSDSSLQVFVRLLHRAKDSTALPLAKEQCPDK